jgi:hypothetical protein
MKGGTMSKSLKHYGVLGMHWGEHTKGIDKIATRISNSSKRGLSIVAKNYNKAVTRTNTSRAMKRKAGKPHSGDNILGAKICSAILLTGVGLVAIGELVSVVNSVGGIKIPIDVANKIPGGVKYREEQKYNYYDGQPASPKWNSPPKKVHVSYSDL